MFSYAEHADQITVLIQQVADAGQTVGYNALRDQVKTYTDEFPGCTMMDDFPSGFKVAENPRFEQLMGDKDLSSIRLRELSATE